MTHNGSLQERRNRGTVCLADGGDDHQGGGGHWLPRYWPGGGPVEGGIWHNQFPDIVFHPVPWCSIWILRRDRNGDCHPRDKYAAEVHFHEGDIPPFHLPQPTQGLQRTVQGPMYWYTGRVWSGSQDALHNAYILGPDPDCGKGGGALRARLPETSWGNSVGGLSPTIFNVVVDAVLQHWVTVVGRGGRRAPDRAWERQFRPYWHFSTPMMDSSRHQRSPAFGERSIPWRASLTKSAPGPTRGRQWAWPAGHVTPPHAWSTKSYTRLVTRRGLSYRKILC